MRSAYFKKTGALYRKIDTRKKLVALTYDDGPSKNTNTILKVLKKYDSTATFFEVGNRIASYKSIVKKIDKMGCEIEIIHMNIKFFQAAAKQR